MHNHHKFKPMQIFAFNKWWGQLIIVNLLQLSQNTLTNSFWKYLLLFVKYPLENELKMEIIIGNVEWKIINNLIVHRFQMSINSTNFNESLKNSSTPELWTQVIRTWQYIMNALNHKSIWTA